MDNSSPGSGSNKAGTSVEAAPGFTNSAVGSSPSRVSYEESSSLESFMTPTIRNLAIGIIVPAVLARIRLRWLAVGVAAYYGLRILNQKGVLPPQATQAFDSLYRGIEAAKEKMGINKTTSGVSIH